MGAIESNSVFNLGREAALSAQLQHSYLCHRPDDHLSFEFGVSSGQDLQGDADLVARIMYAYERYFTSRHSTEESMWFTWIGPMKAPIHDAIMERDVEKVTAFLRDPSSSQLFNGFDNLIAQEDGSNVVPDYWAAWMAAWTYDALRRLAEAVGVCPMAYPEKFNIQGAESGRPNPDELLEKLDAALGFRVLFPNPYRNEVGVTTSRGIATYRAVHALYQAWRVKQLVRDIPNPKVVEIGAGLGRGAYYARQMGITDYTIVDLHMTNVSQAYYLGTVCGQGSVALGGEVMEPDRFKIIPPESFLEGDETYDLAVNVDSFTEMSRAAATNYIDHIRRRAAVMLSINHETNDFTVGQIISNIPERQRTRNPSWIRKGYVEEIVRF